MLEDVSSRPYNLGLTAATLRPELARIVAEQYLDTGSWDETKRRILSSNALQAGSESGAARLEREFRHRLEFLSKDQLTLLAGSTGEDRVAMAWLAVVKRFTFAFELAADLLRSKVQRGDPMFRPSDYESYVDEKTAAHPQLAELSPSTKGKIRRTVITMLGEAGLLGEGSRDARPIRRPVLSPSATDVIAAEDPRWLAAFLVPETEIAPSLQGQP